MDTGVPGKPYSIPTPSMCPKLFQVSGRRRGCGGLVVFFLIFLVTGSFLALNDTRINSLVNRESFLKFIPVINSVSLPAPDPPIVFHPFQPHTFWILPTMAPAGKMPDIMDTWGVFVPTELQKSFSATCKNCYYEDSQSLLSFLYNVTEISRTNSPTEMVIIRKMASLLFLIKQKTQGILQTSDHSSAQKSIQRFFHDNQPYGVSGLEYFADEVTLEALHYLYHTNRDYSQPCRYRIRYKMKPIWTVAVRCMFLQDAAIPGKVSRTDPHSPPIFASTPKFSIDTFSDSYFGYEGFWAMFASLFVSNRLTTRVWSLWAQRMLQEMEGEMALTSLACPANREQFDTIHYEPDAEIKKLYQFLKTWKCSESVSFFSCSELLVTALCEQGFVDKHDVILHKLWLQGLERVGYVQPKRISTVKNYTSDAFPFCVMHSAALLLTSTEEPKPEKLFPNIVKSCDPPRQRGIDPFREYAITKPSKMRNVAVILLFYHASYYHYNMPKLYDLYNKYFPNFIFCGPDYKHFTIFQQIFRKPVSFIEVLDTHAFLGQECMTRAMAMNLDVEGYLQYADDTLISVWNVGELPKDKLWFQREVLTANRETNYIADFFKKTVPWIFWKEWGGMYGKVAIKQVWARFEAISNEDNAIAKGIVDSYLNTLYANLGNKNGLYYQASDVFYVPARLRRQWLFLADIFNANNVFLEIAIPTMIYGLDKFDDVLKMAGNYLWYQQRPVYQKYYKFTHHFQHPWKMSWMKNKRDRDFLCRGVLAEIVKERTTP